MRIAAWNVNGLRARLEFFLAWLGECRPDVLCLQELKLEGSAFPADAVSEAGYHAEVFGQKSWNGVAVLSREPAELVTLGLPGQEDFGSRLITVDVGPLRVTSVYVPNGKSLDHPDFPRKLAWLDSLIGHLEAMNSDRPWIVAGDFNVCPAPLDSWDETQLAGNVFHTEEERSRLARLAALGWQDAFRRCNPDAKEFSWWDYRGGAFHRRHGLRIDLLLVNAAAAVALKGASIDRDARKKRGELTPSDHAPVLLELDRTRFGE